MDQYFTYVSCIKLNGVPILPPLVTSDRRRELVEYKRQALLLEERYSSRKSILKESRDESKLNHSKLHQLEANASIISNTQSCNIEIFPRKNESSLKYVPFKNVNLSSSLIDVSEYSLDTKEVFENQGIEEVKLTSTDTTHPSISHEDNYNSDSLNLFSGSTEIVLKKDETVLEDEKEVCEKPRLIRSNSYTLDNPSPLLLAHLKRQSSVSLSSDQELTDSSHGEIESTKAHFFKSSNKEKNHSETDILDVSPDLKISDVSKSNEISVVKKENMPDHCDSLSLPTIEVITTDIIVQEINITTPINDGNRGKKHMDYLREESSKNDMENLRNVSLEAVQISDTDPETELKTILKEIPEMYSSKILEIIEKQKIEQQKQLKDQKFSTLGVINSRNAQNTMLTDDLFDKALQNWQLNSFNSAQNIVSESLCENIEISRKARSVSDSTILNVNDSPKQGRYSVVESPSLHMDMTTSCSEPLEDFSSRTVKTIDDIDEYIPNNRGIYDDMYLHTLKLVNTKENSIKKIKPLTEERMQREKENKAASVIGAHIKGYLVRRLMRTVRVQTLIQTIQDALLCALELQGLETIEEADVELHRRLIQQVSAACYEFHDVFFALTIPEQMDLIAIDREKKRKIMPVRTSRSSIDFLPKGRSSSSTRLTKSLTKV